MGCSKAALSYNYPNWQKYNKFKLLILGIDASRFMVQEEKKGLRKSLNIPEDSQKTR